MLSTKKNQYSTLSIAYQSLISSALRFRHLSRNKLIFFILMLVCLFTFIPSITLAQVATPEPLTNEELLEQIETLSTDTLAITQWVLSLLVPLLISAGGITVFYNTRLSNSQDDLRQKFYNEKKEQEDEQVKLRTYFQEQYQEVGKRQEEAKNEINQLEKSIEAFGDEIRRMYRKSAILSFIVQATDQNTDVRKTAIQRLEVYKNETDEGVYAVLIECLKNDKVDDVKIAAAVTLKKLVAMKQISIELKNKSINTLGEIIQAENTDLRNACVVAIHEILESSEEVFLQRDLIRKLQQIATNDIDDNVRDSVIALLASYYSKDSQRFSKSIPNK